MNGLGAGDGAKGGAQDKNNFLYSVYPDGVGPDSELI